MAPEPRVPLTAAAAACHRAAHALRALGSLAEGALSERLLARTPAARAAARARRQCAYAVLKRARSAQVCCARAPACPSPPLRGLRRCTPRVLRSTLP